MHDFRSTSNKGTVPAFPTILVQMILRRWYIHNCFFPHVFSAFSSAHNKMEFWKIIKWFPTVGHKKCSNTSFFLSFMENFIFCAVVGLLTNFKFMLPFYIPWKHQKTSDFLMFSESNRKRSLAWNWLKDSCTRSLPYNMPNYRE